MKFTNELQASTIAELVYLECLKQGVEIAESEEEKDKIFYASAEFLLCNHKFIDLAEIADVIAEYVRETKLNYPLYFKTGIDN